MAHIMESVYRCDRCGHEKRAKWNSMDDATNSTKFHIIQMKDGNEIMLCHSCYDRIIEFLKGESD